MHWPVHELHELSQLIVEIGDCFMVRRTMQRLEAKELTLQEAVVLLRSALESRLSLSDWGWVYLSELAALIKMSCS